MFFVQDIAGNLTSPLWSSDPHIVEKLIAYHPYAFDFLHLSSHVAHLVSRLWDKGWTKTGMPTAAWSEKKPRIPNLLWFQSSYQFRKHIMIHVYLICKKTEFCYWTKTKYSPLKENCWRTTGNGTKSHVGRYGDRFPRFKTWFKSVKLPRILSSVAINRSVPSKK